MNSPMKICFAASEVTPFAKTGGLADVSAALPRQLRRMGHDVRLFMPLHGIVDLSQQEVHRVDFAQDVEVQLGHGVHRFSLLTTKLPGSELDVYLVDCPELLSRPSIYTSDPDEPRRFGLFCRAVIESCQRMGWGPHIFHCNDWHTGLLPLMLRTAFDWDSLFHGSRTVMTVHNIGYQGAFPATLIEELGLGPWTQMFDLEDLGAGIVNFLRTGLIYADALTTVSPTYAREIRTAAYGMGLERLLNARSGRLVGILNGIDHEEWSPERDPHIPHRFSRGRLDGKRKNKSFLQQQMGLSGDTTPPLLGIVSRLTAQKGFELCRPVLPAVLTRYGARLVVLGSGDAADEEFFEWLQRRFPRQVAFYRGYSNELAHLIEAGADILLMPSRYEPCGLNQMFSQRYGTIPVVRRTGGLADSVRQFEVENGNGTGVLFDHFTPEGLLWAIERALALYSEPALWSRLVDNAMGEDFSWEKQASRYVELYSWLGNHSG